MIKLSDYFKQRFGERVIKLSLDGGFTCPNRLGGGGGCHFCSPAGSGDFAGSVRICSDHFVERKTRTDRLASLAEQAQAQKALVRAKWRSGSYLAYFQSYSGTFDAVGRLRSLYREALEIDGVIGFAVATRPDCVDEEIASLLCEPGLREKLFWVELGLQSAHEATLREMNVGYGPGDFTRALNLLSSRGIPAVVHLIAGFPRESREDFMESVRFVAKQKPFGVKIHMLNIVKGSELAKQRTSEEWERALLSMEEYADWVVEALRILPPETVIHRLTGDADHALLVAPQWIKRKWEVLNLIDAKRARQNAAE